MAPGDVQRAFWDELRDLPAELERCWSVLDQLRPPGRPLRELEERLTYLALKDDRAEIDRQLATVVKAMLDDPKRRRDLAAWSARALARVAPVGSRPRARGGAARRGGARAHRRGDAVSEPSLAVRSGLHAVGACYSHVTAWPSRSSPRTSSDRFRSR